MYVTFDQSAYLWYLVSIPLLLMLYVLSLRSTKRKALRFANFQAIKRIAGKKYITKNIWILILRLFVFALLIFALAGVKLWYMSAQSGVSYVLAIDTSSSMSAEDFSPTRLGAAKNYARQFVSLSNGETSIGVVSFSGLTFVEQPLTTDDYALRQAIDSITIAAVGGTDLPSALITSTNLLLAQPDRAKVIMLFSDGSSTLGNFVDQSMTRALDYVKKNAVVINTIGIGSSSAPIGYLPEYYDIPALYEKDNLVLIANATGGRFVEAESDEQLKVVFERLLENATESYVALKLDYWFLMLALILLFVEWGLINTRFRRIT